MEQLDNKYKKIMKLNYSLTAKILNIGIPKSDEFHMFLKCTKISNFSK